MPSEYANEDETEEEGTLDQPLISRDGNLMVQLEKKKTNFGGKVDIFNGRLG